MLITIIVFVAVLGLLVFVHELGHFFASRKFGVKAEEFGFGLPPRIFGYVKIDGKWKFVKGKDKNEQGEKRQYQNTIWSLNWIPVGGFVEIKGQDGQIREESDSFGAKKIWQRMIMMASGVLMNFVLAMLLFSIGYMIGLPQVIDDNSTFKNVKVRDEKIQILSVFPDSAASEAGLTPQDEVYAIDNINFSEISAIQEYIKENSNQEMTLTIKRGQEETKTTITPKNIETEDGKTQKILGVALVKTGVVSYPFIEAIWQGIVTFFLITKLIIVTFYGIIKDLIIHRSLTTEIAGPVGIAVVTGQVVKLGFIYVLQFAAILSINLGVLNFFPFPALDGGRFIGLIVEAIRRKPNNQRVESLIHNIGFGILMALFALVTFRDIFKLGGSLLEKIGFG
ncbi:RIP metalloprotease RseP [Candidatus Falkowbacteria bacterium]|nr:RIP metalloprotease RseP [Candidatus Falkowbacteria bacterium]